ncbi:MAG: hypothetical protein AB1724_09825 [Thermodesulfobacteriota bacterium]
MTEATLQTLDILRSTEHFQSYIILYIPFLLYVYTVEIEKKAWDNVLLGLIFSAAVFLPEYINGLILHFTQYAGLWMTPKNSAFVILVGVNIEISLMFCTAGIVFAKLLSIEKRLSILGIPNRIFIPIAMGLFCVCVEVVLNRFGILVWEYKYWSWPHLEFIFIAYTAPFFLATWVHDNMQRKNKAILFVGLVAANVILWIAFVNILGWM